MTLFSNGVIIILSKKETNEEEIDSSKRKEIKMFNLWTDEWLTVEFSDGDVQTVGIRECLVNAHKIRHVFAVDGKTKQLLPLEYTNIRFLLTVIMDAFRKRFKNIRTLVKLINEGKFDEDVLDNYYEMCVKEGCSFDLFDEERPFLQTDKKSLMVIYELKKEKVDFNTWLEKNLCTVANVNPLLASGNNDIFSRKIDADKFAEFAGVAKPQKITDDLIKNKKNKKKPEDMHSLTYAEYAQYVIYNHVSSQYGGSIVGSSLSVNSEMPPLFIIMKGKTLFDTLLFNAVTFKDVGTAKPIWRWSQYLDFANEKTRDNLWEEDGVLMGLIYPARFIYPIKHANGVVTGIYYSGTLGYVSEALKGVSRKTWWTETREAWAVKREPHVSYRYNEEKKKHSSYVMKYTEQSWMDIVSYINSFDTLEMTTKGLKTYKELMNYLETENVFTLSLYYTEMKDASYLSAGKVQYDIHKRCLLDDSTFRSLKEAMMMIKKVSSNLKFCINAYLLKTKQVEITSENIGKESFGNAVVSSFYAKSKHYFFNTYMPALCSCNTREEREQVDNEAEKFFVETALSLYNGIIPCDSFIFAHMTCGDMLNNMLKKIKEKDKEDSDET